MGAIRTLTAGAGRGGVRTRDVFGVTVALAAVALGGAGCQSVAHSRTSMMRAVGLTPAAPPREFICMVESGIQELPDTTRGGRPTKAILGKMFLFGADRQPAEADGQLTLMMADATPRPPGAPTLRPEVVNIDQTALKSLRGNDERFGRCYAFVLPWPAEWTGVEQVTIQASYKPDPSLNAPTMYHQVMKVSLNNNLQVIDQRTGQLRTGTADVSPVMGSVPDPDQLLKQFQAGGGQPLAAPATQPTMTAGNYLPPTTTAGPNGSRVTTTAWTAPPPGGPVMPTIQPPAAFSSQPLMPPALGNLPPTATSPPTSGSQPFVWPPPGGVNPPPVGPIGELRPDGMLQPVVIPRQ